MNKTNKWLALGLLVFASTITSCKDDDPEPTPVGAYETGIFITNEGPFTSGTGTVSFYNRSSGAVSNDIFETVNAKPLGNIVQSITIHNGKGYIVVNNANKIEVVNAGNFTSTASITGLDLPRFFLGIDNTKGYVSQWGSTGLDGSVKVINLSTNTVSSTIVTGSGAENMVKAGNAVYVNCKGGFGNDSVVTVINTATDAVSTTINAGPNPSGIQVDANGKVWVLCGGQWNSTFTELEKTGKLVRINPTTNTIEQTFTFSSIYSTPSNLCINGAKDKLYYTYEGGVYSQDISASSLNSSSLFSGYFYGLGVDPTNDYVYGADAGNFSSNGNVFRFTPAGTKIDSFQVGIVPGNFFFK